MDDKTPLPREYFIEALALITQVAAGYDGYNPNDADQMRGLVDELNKMANDALSGKPLYYTGNNEPVWDPLMTEGNLNIHKTL